MSLLHKPVEQIDRADIDSLITGEVVESRTIDYKATLLADTADDKKELCFDVSAFANALGGDILFGVTERRDENGKNTGIPAAATGIAGLNFEQERLRLEQVLYSKIQPKLPSLQFKEVRGDIGPIMFLRVSRSWAMPHLVTNDKWLRAYIRASGSKGAPLDVVELRTAFLLSQSLPDRVRGFRDSRLPKIMSGDTPVKVQANSKVVIHAVSVPVSEGTVSLGANAEALRRLPCPAFVPDDHQVTHNFRFNLDGLLLYDTEFDVFEKQRGAFTTRYVQVFRAGAVEAVGTLDTDSEYLPLRFGGSLAAYVQALLKMLRDDGFVPPIYVLVTLLNVNGRRLYVHRLRREDLPPGEWQPFDRATLPLPEVLFESLDGDPKDLLRPALDALWQAGGWAWYFEP